jgi:hypothetical protein
LYLHQSSAAWWYSTDLQNNYFKNDHQIIEFYQFFELSQFLTDSKKCAQFPRTVTAIDHSGPQPQWVSRTAAVKKSPSSDTALRPSKLKKKQRHID